MRELGESGAHCAVAGTHSERNSKNPDVGTSVIALRIGSDAFRSMSVFNESIRAGVVHLTIS